MGVFVISIIVATYLKENQRYLDLCLESISRQTYRDFEVILVSSGEHIPTHPDWVKAHHSPERLHYPEAINFGQKFTDQSSKYLMLMGDDAFMTETALEDMVRTMGDSQFIANPVSNCDNSSFYNLILGYEKDGFQQMKQRFYRYDDLKDVFEPMMKSRSVYAPGIIQRPFVCFYATIIPRSVWNKVGELDPNFKTGQDDADYCKRAINMGIPSGVILNAIIWHFGGVTADVALNNEIRSKNIEYYRQKWGENPP